MIGPPAAEDEVDRATVRQLSEALAASAGVPAVAEATGNAYRHRAAASTGWPVVRGLRRLRPDPLRRLHLADRRRDRRGVDRRRAAYLAAGGGRRAEVRGRAQRARGRRPGRRAAARGLGARR